MNNYTRATPKVGVLNFKTWEQPASVTTPLDTSLSTYHKEQQERAIGNRREVMEVYETINCSDNFTAAAQYHALFGKEFEE